MTDENGLHERRDDDCLFAAIALVYFTILVLAGRDRRSGDLGTGVKSGVSTERVGPIIW
jgi:hypothetical protein